MPYLEITDTNEDHLLITGCKVLNLQNVYISVFKSGDNKDNILGFECSKESAIQIINHLKSEFNL